MKIKQKRENNGRADIRNEDYIYSKNPRFKIQKVLRSKIVEFNQKPVLMKSYQSIPEDENNQEKIHPGTLGLKNNPRPSRYNEELQRDYRSCLKKSLKTQFDLRTIDVIKEEISKTLEKDLITLKNNRQSQLSTKNRNSLRLKLQPTRNRSHTINYNECCGLAEERYQRDLLLNPERQVVDVTPKLGVYQNKVKTVAPLIYFLKKKDITQRIATKDNQLSLRKKKYSLNSEADFRSVTQEKNQFHSERKVKAKQMQKLREDLYSPWQITLNKYEANPQITQALFGICKYNKSQK